MRHVSEYPAAYIGALINYDDRLYHPGFDCNYAAKILEYKGLAKVVPKISEQTGRTYLYVQELVRLGRDNTFNALYEEMKYDKNLYYQLYRRTRAALFGCAISKRAGLCGWIFSLATRLRK